MSDQNQSKQLEIEAALPAETPPAKPAQGAPEAPPEGPKAEEVGKVDPETALKGTVSITVTFMALAEGQPEAERLIVSTIRADQGLPLAIKTCRQADLNLPALFDELRAAMADALLKQATVKKPARTITIEKPKAAAQPEKKPAGGQLGLF